MHMVLRTLILQTPEGVPVFGRSLVCSIGSQCLDISQDSTFDDETILKSGLFNALMTMHEKEGDDFHEIALTEVKLLGFHSDKINGIFEVDHEEEDGSLKNRLRLMVELFENTYKEKLDSFKGDIAPFNQFTDVIEIEGLLDSGEKWKKNCLDCKYSKSCSFRVTTGEQFETAEEKFNSIPEISKMRKMALMIRGLPVSLYNNLR